MRNRGLTQQDAAKRMGITQPKAVLAHTAEYFDEQDGFARFLDEETTPGGFVSNAALFDRFKAWAHREGEYVGDVKWLGRQLTRKRVEKVRTRDSRGYVLTLKADKLLQEGR